MLVLLELNHSFRVTVSGLQPLCSLPPMHSPCFWAWQCVEGGSVSEGVKQAKGTSELDVGKNPTYC